jgi:hypothetical protein
MAYLVELTLRAERDLDYLYQWQVVSFVTLQISGKSSFSEVVNFDSPTCPEKLCINILSLNDRARGLPKEPLDRAHCPLHPGALLLAVAGVASRRWCGDNGAARKGEKAARKGERLSFAPSPDA